MSKKKETAMTMLYKGEEKKVVDANDEEAFAKLEKAGWKDAPAKLKAEKKTK